MPPSPFLVCVHDATPAFARATRVMIQDLEPLVGRHLALAVVPDWQGQWPLKAHPDYCRLIQDASEELLLHGYFHRRQRGWGPAAWLTGRCDERNGLDPEATRCILERGQRVFEDAFGKPARGFVAPAWQPGHARLHNESTSGLEHVVSYFSLESRSGRRVPLVTWTWDCGRWPWLGYLGHGIGRLLQSLDRGVPMLAIHPRDLERGFWPGVLRLIRKLLDEGYAPSTPADLIAGKC